MGEGVRFWLRTKQNGQAEETPLGDAVGFGVDSHMHVTARPDSPRTFTLLFRAATPLVDYTYDILLQVKRWFDNAKCSLVHEIRRQVFPGGCIAGIPFCEQGETPSKRYHIFLDIDILHKHKIQLPDLSQPQNQDDYKLFPGLYVDLSLLSLYPAISRQFSQIEIRNLVENEVPLEAVKHVLYHVYPTGIPIRAHTVQLLAETATKLRIPIVQEACKKFLLETEDLSVKQKLLICDQTNLSALTFRKLVQQHYREILHLMGINDLNWALDFTRNGQRVFVETMDRLHTDGGKVSHVPEETKIANGIKTNFDQQIPLVASVVLGTAHKIFFVNRGLMSELSPMLRKIYSSTATFQVPFESDVVEALLRSVYPEAKPVQFALIYDVLRIAEHLQINFVLTGCEKQLIESMSVKKFTAKVHLLLLKWSQEFRLYNLEKAAVLKVNQTNILALKALPHFSNLPQELKLQISMRPLEERIAKSDDLVDLPEHQEVPAENEIQWMQPRMIRAHVESKNRVCDVVKSQNRGDFLHPHALPSVRDIPSEVFASI